MSLMPTFESMTAAQQQVVREISDAARQSMRDQGIMPRNGDQAAIFDEACAKFVTASSKAR